jgi:putative membrane protein
MVASTALALAACGGSGDEAAVTNSGAMTNSDFAMNVDDTIPDQIPAAMTGQGYADKAAASDLYEIQSAQLAQEKSKRDDVKDLAKMIVADHEKSTADLKAAAQQAQPPITVAPKLDEQQEANMAALRAANAADFDQAYLQQQIAAHQQALTMVQGYAENGDVPALKQHAANVAGPIQKHLDRAQELARTQ